MIELKSEAELRHVISHLVDAIEHLVAGHPTAAQYELDSIAGLVFWDRSEDMRVYLDGKTTEETTNTTEMHRESSAPGDAGEGNGA